MRVLAGPHWSLHEPVTRGAGVRGGGGEAERPFKARAALQEGGDSGSDQGRGGHSGKKLLNSGHPSKAELTGFLDRWCV
jgi:hypothetical protein